MANTFDEVIRLALEVTGAKDVSALQGALQALGDSGSEAAPKARELLDALTQLGANNAAVNALVAQKAAFGRLGQRIVHGQG